MLNSFQKNTSKSETTKIAHILIKGVKTEFFCSEVQLNELVLNPLFELLSMSYLAFPHRSCTNL